MDNSDIRWRVVEKECTCAVSYTHLDVYKRQLFGVDEHSLWMALIVANFRDLFPKLPITLPNLQDMVARHWHRGVGLLISDWEEAGGYSKFVEILITRRATLSEDIPDFEGAPERGSGEGWAGPEAVAKAVRVDLGKEENTDTSFVWTVNGVGYSPHIAVMGQAGSCLLYTSRCV